MGDNAGDVGNDAPNFAVPASQYTSNPIRKRGRREGSPVWKYVKLLTGSHEECFKADKDTSKRTHVCGFEQKGDKYYSLLRCQRNSYGGLNTTEPLRHYHICHPVSAFGKEQSSKESKKSLGVIDSFSAASSGAPGLSAKMQRLSATMHKFVQSSMNPGFMSIALDKTTHWFIVGMQRISKSTFEDPYFRKMLAGCFRLAVVPESVSN